MVLVHRREVGVLDEDIMSVLRGVRVGSADHAAVPGMIPSAGRASGRVARVPSASARPIREAAGDRGGGGRAGVARPDDGGLRARGGDLVAGSPVGDGSARDDLRTPCAHAGDGPVRRGVLQHAQRRLARGVREHDGAGSVQLHEQELPGGAQVGARGERGGRWTRWRSRGASDLETTPNRSTPATMPAAGRAPPFDVRATVLSSTT